MQATRARLSNVAWSALAGLPLAAALKETLQGTPTERTLERFLKAHRALDAAGRRAAAEALLGASLWRRRLSALLRMPSPEEAGPQRLLYAFWVDVAGCDPASSRRWAGLGPQDVPPLADGALSFEERHSMPDWLAAEVRRRYGPQADAMAEALNAPGPVFLRVNGLRGTREEVGQRLGSEGVATSPCRHARWGLVARERFNVLGSPTHQAGDFEVQDEGSQLIAQWVGVRPGEVVLDSCAGAGGKSLALGAALRNRGELHVRDVDFERLDRLERRAQAAGLTCLRIHRGPCAPLAADRVLVDAPCSELGVLRRGPDVRWRLEPQVFLSLPALQERLLREAAAFVKPGGRLVYATCTFRREENEAVAEAFDAAPPESGPGFDRGHRLRLAPHAHGTDAFFAAVWRRRML